MDEIKRALGSNLFLRDLAKLEPGKKGVAVGESVRIYEDKGGYLLAFLRGTDEKSRRVIREKLDTARISYKPAPDFAL